MLTSLPQQSGNPVISVIVPMHNESAGMDLLFVRLMPVLQSCGSSWEILCVDDGSTDDTQARLLAWNQKENRIKMLSLSRNFGKEAALSAGLDYALGDAVIPLDADLQDPPELIPQMLEQWRLGYKVVLATRRSRKGDSLFKRSAAHAYYRLIRKVTSIPIPADTGDFRLLDRQVVEVMRRLPERTRIMKGLFAWAGFKTATLYYDREPRAAGSAQQSPGKLWQLAKDGLFSFTTLPLQLTTYMGIAFSAIAFTYASFLVLRTLFFGIDVPGYVSIMVTVLGIGGVQLICLGIMGEYIGRIYRETKQRPLYVIEQIAGIQDSNDKKLIN